MTSARVVLRGCESYTFNKKTWIKDVPQIVKGEDLIKQFEANGYFLVKRLPSAQPDPRRADNSDGGTKKFVKRTLPEKTEEEDHEDGDGDEETDHEDDVNA
ncbi:MAG: hypothetical protein AB7G93_11860 [Bdellovibrionales bacterium]